MHSIPAAALVVIKQQCLFIETFAFISELSCWNSIIKLFLLDQLLVADYINMNCFSLVSFSPASLFTWRLWLPPLAIKKWQNPPQWPNSSHIHRNWSHSTSKQHVQHIYLEYVFSNKNCWYVNYSFLFICTNYTVHVHVHGRENNRI